MPNKAIQNAKRLRAGALGQSSRFYNIYGQQVKASNPNGFKGGQGWTTHNPSIGSMLSNGIMKQNKNAGGNNVCQPGPGPTSVIDGNCNCRGPSGRCPCRSNGGNTLPAYALLIINTVSTFGQVGGGPARQDTFITAYKTSTAAAKISDDLDNDPSYPFQGVPQNFASYNNKLYQDVYDFENTSFDIDLSTMNGGDTYRFIISTFETSAQLFPNLPLYGQTSTTTVPPTGGTALDPAGIRINYGIAMVDQKPSNQPGVGGILSVPPLSLQNTFIDTNGYYYLTIDLTLSSDKKTVTHTIVT